MSPMDTLRALQLGKLSNSDDAGPIDPQMLEITRKFTTWLEKVFKHHKLTGFSADGYNRFVISLNNNLFGPKAQSGAASSSALRRRMNRSRSRGRGRSRGLTVRGQDQQQSFFYYDFMAVCIFAAGIILLYVSYLTMCKLSGKVLGATPAELSEEAKQHINNALKDADSQERGFFVHAMSALTSFGSSVADRRFESLRAAFRDSLAMMAPNFADEIKNSCFADTSTWTGWLEGLTKAAVSSDVTTACVMRVSGIQGNAFMQQQMSHLDLLMQVMETQTLQMTALASYGSKSVWGFFTYVGWRIKNRRKTSRLLLGDRERGRQLTDNGAVSYLEGGRHKKMTRRKKN